MNATARRQLAMSEDYEEVKGLIRKTVHDFRAAHVRPGTSFDDLMSIANEYFVRAYDSWDVSKGARFITWVRNRVWWGLMDAHKRASYRAAILNNTHEDVAHMADNVRAPFLDVLDELSVDARTVVGLTLSAPRELVHTAFTREKGVRPTTFRAALRKYLRSEFGWDTGRVRGSFDEIRRVLNDEGVSLSKTGH